MEIATILNAHGHTDIVLDTVDSIKEFVGDDILLVVDGAAWEEWGKDLVVPAGKIEGFWHNHPKAPYRNLTYGLLAAWQNFGNKADWYCYCEYDVLFTSSDFKEDLEKNADAWCMGNNLRERELNLPYLEGIASLPLKDGRYLLGCCVFYSKEFIKTLYEMEFFSKFLHHTNQFPVGFFPGFDGFDLGEYLYPTLAHNLGGEVRQLAYYNHAFDLWAGDFERYRMRWKPELTWEHHSNNSSIMHPIKENSDLRWFYSCQRKRRKNVQS